MGVREARDSVGQVYRFLRHLGTQISLKGLGGPISIAQQAGQAASQGLPELLLFLTMLSANLAVINFLPIPILDGGHMVFLLLEGILKRPVSERVVIAFHYAGFLFIISLMLFVLSLDIGRLIMGPLGGRRGGSAAQRMATLPGFSGKSRTFGWKSRKPKSTGFSLLSGLMRPGSIRPRKPNPLSGGQYRVSGSGAQGGVRSGATLGKDFRCR